MKSDRVNASNYSQNEDVDFVIIWVDGNDPEWRAERNLYASNPDDDNREVRFRSWDNLQYWFRGVEKYAPWVHKIYFVTWGHLPKWLDTSNTKLVIVNHRDYIPEKYLPTFNSHTIELNLHRIKGLSEHFVYFNDDMFLVSDVKKEDFFLNGYPKDIFALNTIYFGDDSIGNIVGSNMSVINNHFKKKECFKRYLGKYLSFKYGIHNIRTLLLMAWRYFPGFYDNHLPSCFVKSTFHEVWDAEPEILDYTASCKFRKSTNVSQWLLKYWQLCSGNFSPMRAGFGKSYKITGDDLAFIKDVTSHKYSVICINDNEKLVDFDKTANQIKEMFDVILKEKSSFEI